MTDVITFTGITRVPSDARQTLTNALAADLTTAVVIGWDRNGKLYFASSEPDGGSVLWLMEVSKKKLLEAGDG